MTQLGQQLRQAQFAVQIQPIPAGILGDNDQFPASVFR